MPGQRAPEEQRREQILSAAYAVALRTGIAGVTLRAVAVEAGLSHGLLLFHFERKDELIGALLDRVLATTVMLHRAEDGTTSDDPHSAGVSEALVELLQRELDRFSHDPRGIRLFFEYWALGVREPTIRAKIGEALERYRAAFRSMAEDILAADVGRGADSAPVGLTADALASVAVSLVSGCAVQAMIDPVRFDTAAYLAAVHGLLERLAPPAEA